MKTVPAQKVRPKPLILTSREEAILHPIATHYYMSALDVAHLLYSPKSLTHVRQVLSRLAGNADYVDRQLLYRFPLPTPTKGMKARVYALGAKGREVLAKEGYYRPYKLRYISYSHILHHLALTRFVVAAHYWCRRKHAGFNLLQTRLCYELARTVATFSLETQGRTTTMPVIPDAWLLFQRVKDGAHFPVFLEIDRSTEYRQKLQAHIKARLEMVRIAKCLVPRPS